MVVPYNWVCVVGGGGGGGGGMRCQREHLQFILIIYRVTALYDSGDTGNNV